MIAGWYDESLNEDIEEWMDGKPHPGPGPKPGPGPHPGPGPKPGPGPQPGPGPHPGPEPRPHPHPKPHPPLCKITYENGTVIKNHSCPHFMNMTCDLGPKKVHKKNQTYDLWACMPVSFFPQFVYINFVNHDNVSLFLHIFFMFA